jgi:hypothetical protein
VGSQKTGKSTLAEQLCRHYGTSEAFRAKIVYFNNVASDKADRSIYEISEQQQALSLFHGLEKFARAHYWLKIISIESMHRVEVTRWLKSWLGDRLRVLYIDVSQQKRYVRTLVSPEAVARHDAMKQEPGGKPSAISPTSWCRMTASMQTRLQT